MPFPKYNPNKYFNKRQTCRSGHSHGSIGEANYCDYLANLVKLKHIKSYKSQVSYPLAINGKTVCSHIVDFEVINADGSLCVHEFKGFCTDIWILKKKMFEAIYPKIPYNIIKYSYKWKKDFKLKLGKVIDLDR